MSFQEHPAAFRRVLTFARPLAAVKQHAMPKAALSLLLVFSTLAVPALAADTGNVDLTPLVTKGRADCVIVCDTSNALIARTAAKLHDFFSEQTAAKPLVVADADSPDAAGAKTLIVIDGFPDQRLVAKLGVKAEGPPDRDDAYALKTASSGNRRIIAAVGRRPVGAKYAIYRLIEEMQIDGKTATVGPLDVKASPFFATRSVSLFNIWRVPVDVVRQCNLESWPAEKVQRNVDMYDAFGFNAVETHDRFHEDFLKAVYGITRAEWREKVYVLCDRAHADGMTVFLRLWGNSVALPVKELKGGYTPFGFVNLAPDIPDERKRWEVEIRDYASKNYASHIDHLIGHWADAGGVHPGSHATVKDSMLLHNELVDAFRAINPKVQSSFNLWRMANPAPRRGWPGYVDHHSICDAGILSKDVAIAQTTRSRSHRYSEQVTADILASGHPAAVWTWRRADTEVRFGDAGLRIRVHGLIGDYFHGLPVSARTLAWHNIERNHHGLANDVNYYIAGKLMWDPKADVDTLLQRYCGLVFGRENAKTVAEACDTIEACRDIEKFVSRETVEHPEESARRAKAALNGLNKIKLADGHRSRLPSVVSPAEMLEQLRGTLEVIAETADLIAGRLREIDALVSAGKIEEARAAAAPLREKAGKWSNSVAGGTEGHWLSETLNGKLGDRDSPGADGPERTRQ
jgi:hypothetical protein